MLKVTTTWARMQRLSVAGATASQLDSRWIVRIIHLSLIYIKLLLKYS